MPRVWQEAPGGPAQQDRRRISPTKSRSRRRSFERRSSVSGGAGHPAFAYLVGEEELRSNGWSGRCRPRPGRGSSRFSAGSGRCCASSRPGNRRCPRMRQRRSRWRPAGVRCFAAGGDGRRRRRPRHLPARGSRGEDLRRAAGGRSVRGRGTRRPAPGEQVRPRPMKKLSGILERRLDRLGGVCCTAGARGSAGGRRRR